MKNKKIRVDGVAILVSIPTGNGVSRKIDLDPGSLAQNRIAYGPRESDIIDYYKVLRTQLMQKMVAKNHKTILVTSSVEGEGATLTALNLAISFAKVIDQYVLLVESDLRNPSLQAMLALNDSMPGLADYLLDDVPIQELLIDPGIERLRLLLAGRKTPSSAELLGSGKMSDLVEEFKTRYDNRYIIFDAPALMAYPDTLVLSDLIDAIVVVIEAGSTPLERIMDTEKKLRDKNMIGFVLNKGYSRGFR
jgi:capsular exopolysaccharide synthesis family protein